MTHPKPRLSLENTGNSIPTDELTGMLGVAQLRVGDFVTSRSTLMHALRRGGGLGVVWLGLTALEGTADWLGAARKWQRASVYWAAVDAIGSVTRNRTPGDDLGIFTASRSRDRAALTLSAQEAAITRMADRCGSTEAACPRGVAGSRPEAH